MIKKIYCVGIGPGNNDEITPKALSYLQDADVIVGYGVYTDLIKDLVADKEIVTTPMRKETERCKIAVELANQCKKVAMISSGDAGIYGMTSLIYQIIEEQGLDIEVETAAGITAAVAAACVLGSPLTNDFAVVSLSDLLTPWDLIEKRVRLAVQADFVLCIYNPSSKKRSDYLEKICNMALEYISPDTCCGYVRNIGRIGEEHFILSLKELVHAHTDMFTTVIIGNKFTEIINNKLITPRGYRIMDSKE